MQTSLCLTQVTGTRCLVRSRHSSGRTFLKLKRQDMVCRCSTGQPQGGDDQSKGFGSLLNTTTKVNVKGSSKASMAQYQRLMAAEQAAREATQQAEPQRLPRVETPIPVGDRMLKRIILFTGVPVFTGMALLPVFYWLKVVQKVEVEVWMVYIVQAIMFGGGLLGISYAVLSSSWESGREGSLLGWQEFQANVRVLMEQKKRG